MLFGYQAADDVTTPSRHIARRSNDAAFGRIPDRYRLALESRIVTLFYRRIERVHVDVDDLANPPFVIGRRGT